VGHPSPAPLRAPLDIEFDYTRSLGPVLSRFMTALADRRILGARGADGRVHAPPFEYDPVSSEPPGELTEVGPEGTVVSWSWMPEPLAGQPLAGPFAWALIRLDGADTAMLHAVSAGSAAAMRTGLRVRPRWAERPAGSIRDITCFEPCDGPAGTAAAGSGGEPREITPGLTVTPVRLHYMHTASPGETAYLRGLAEHRLLGQRCGMCGQVYVPPRGTCPADGVPTSEEVELPESGTVTTFCIVNVGYPGQKDQGFTPPYVAAAVLLDGADIAFQHLVLGCDPAEVRMGMRVRAVWGEPGSISHFTPTGEPDAEYESYAGSL